MGRTVFVEDDESIEQALRRLRIAQAYEFKRWSKRRHGYYEKPSALKRKRRKMAEIWSRHDNAGRLCRRTSPPSRHATHLFIGLPELFARTGPTNAAGR